MTRPIASAPSSWLNRAAAAALRPVDLAPLVWFRIAFGLLMLVEVTRYFNHRWIERYFIEPAFYFKYYGFGWVQPWPAPMMYAHFAVLAVLALCIMAGCFYRLATVLFFLGFTYVFLLDQARYLNHFYLVCLYSFLLIFVPANGAFSLDAWRRPGLRRDTAPAWTLWLLRFQISCVYFFGGVAKLNADWLQGEPLRMWLGGMSRLPLLGPIAGQAWTPWFLSYGGLCFDLGIAPLLWWPRTRKLAFVLAGGFNLTNALLFKIGIFPWLSFGATVLLFATRLPRPCPELWKPAAAQPAPSDGRRPRLTLALVGCYVLFQIAMPLRHWLYPGDVQWTEEGHRFSWRMKLRSKKADLAMIARDPATNETWDVSPLEYLNPAQIDEASSRPDMILQLCQRVAAVLREDGHPRIEVRARVIASLNGRPPQVLIDPDVDLAAQPRTLRHVNWIVPLTTPLDPADALGRESDASSD